MQQNTPVDCPVGSCLIPFFGAGEGQFTIIDEADYDLVAGRKWYLRQGYAFTAFKKGGKQFSQLMHRVLMNASTGVDVDHINRNRLDNRRSNLRLCTRGENVCNRTKSAGKSSIYKGVQYSKSGYWIARIEDAGKAYSLGYYKDELEAAKAYDAAARYYFGEYANTNFIGSDKKSADDFQQERREHRGVSQYLGVIWDASRQKWQARIKIGDKVFNLGRFNDENSAARAVDIKLTEMHSPKKLNFPVG